MSALTAEDRRFIASTNELLGKVDVCSGRKHVPTIICSHELRRIVSIAMTAIAEVPLDLDPIDDARTRAAAALDADGPGSPAADVFRALVAEYGIDNASAGWQRALTDRYGDPVAGGEG